ncbi:MAG: formylglycine-generating enzyme family protein [Patescibacteria group bacterium]|nr:formylglycine-generating enzyme family protein [Patescibacteria group bacterium]
MTPIEAPYFHSAPVSPTRELASALERLRVRFATTNRRIHHLGAGYPHPEVSDPRSYIAHKEGSFPFGAEDGDPYRMPWVSLARDIYVHAFAIGRVPVTNRLYRGFDPAHLLPANLLEQVNEAELLDHPVVNVSWYEAALFTEWLSQVIPGVRLPSEIEWEKAAGWDSAKSRKMRFPWGDEWRPEYVNSWERGPNRTTLAGSYLQGAAPCGALDMAGNVWEWCSNWFIEGDTLEHALAVGGRFPELEDDGTNRRVDRGGGWYHDVGYPATHVRAGDDPGDRFAHCGFRLACSDIVS